MSKHDDEDDDDKPRGDWVLASYHCYFGVSFNFVASEKGKPRPDWHCTSDRLSAYRWNSYHAAAKFKRGYPKLKGYMILNLSRIERQAEQQRQDNEEWIHRDREPAAVVAPAQEQTAPRRIGRKRGSQK